MTKKGFKNTKHAWKSTVGSDNGLSPGCVASWFGLGGRSWSHPLMLAVLWDMSQQMHIARSMVWIDDFRAFPGLLLWPGAIFQSPAVHPYISPRIDRHRHSMMERHIQLIFSSIFLLEKLCIVHSLKSSSFILLVHALHALSLCTWLHREK